MTASDIRSRIGVTAKCPVHTPWGQPQTAEVMIEDKVVFLSTSSHGGYWVEPKTNRLIPKVFRNARGWYEEDCCAAVVDYFLGHLYSAKRIAEFAKRNGENLSIQDAAMKLLKTWFWKDTEEHFKIVISEGESYSKDRDMFADRHKNDLVVISAFGGPREDENVPDGFVGCYCTLGGERRTPYSRPAEVKLLIPKSEYKTRSSCGFVVPSDHKYQTWDRPSH